MRRLGRERAGHLDVQQHLAVRAVGVGRVVLGVVDQHRLDLRVGDAQRREVGAEVGRLVAAAQLDDADALAAAVGVGGEVVQLGERRRRERLGRAPSACPARARSAGSAGRRRGGRPGRTRPRRRPARSPGTLTRAGAAAVGARRVLVLLQRARRRRRSWTAWCPTARRCGAPRRTRPPSGRAPWRRRRRWRGPAASAPWLAANCSRVRYLRWPGWVSSPAPLAASACAMGVFARRRSVTSMRSSGRAGPIARAPSSALSFAARDGVSAGHGASFATEFAG